MENSKQRNKIINYAILLLEINRWLQKIIPDLTCRLTIRVSTNTAENADKSTQVLWIPIRESFMLFPVLPTRPMDN